MAAAVPVAADAPVAGLAADDRLVTETALSYGLPPVWRPDARILILGSLPGVASLQAAQYYAHPRNQFWPLLQALTGLDARAPYPQRLQALQQQQIALWDLIGAAERSGSLDSAIRSASVQLNDFSSFLHQLPQLQAIWLNGGTAAKSWHKLQKAGLALPPAVRLWTLPSSSPAHAALSFGDKLAQWQQAWQHSRPSAST